MGRILILFAIGAAIWYFALRPKEGGSGSFIGSVTNLIAPKIGPSASKPAPSPVPAPPAGSTPAGTQPTGSGGFPNVPGQPTPQVIPSMSLAAGASNHAPPGAVQGVPSNDVPPVSDVYVMNFRPVPSPEFLQGWERLGVMAIADPVARVVFFRGLAGPCDSFKTALVAMDQLPAGCSVQAWTVYVDRRVEKGFDLVAALGAITGATDTKLTIGPSGLALDVGADRISAALDVIAEGGSVEVVQNPYVRLLNGEPAKVESTQEVPIAETIVSNGISQGSIRYRKVGLQLEVTPTFFANDRVRLGVVQTNGVVGASVQVGGNSVPVIQSQTVSSVADMTVGQTLVLGGVRTTRNVVKKHLIGSSTEISEGALYVILSTYTDEPKAVLVDAPEQPFPAGVLDAPPPLTEPATEGRDWIIGELLPPRDWQSQEKAFLRERRAPAK
ncbi:hypothetical protein OKA05_02990 [Luteolibacter arcticus]|uniref:Type II/III secretion system secretin-like domain-containing protein n=1 Tax=Luteolibacter arcticus TaxID=1581411 RepID=A0ABT3GD04_9BACT|nr:hypothetical protein [Luteolibacter arcticus]MCW1921502.1 hypothetical protein [Luteolibacter arcticus]